MAASSCSLGTGSIVQIIICPTERGLEKRLAGYIRQHLPHQLITLQQDCLSDQLITRNCFLLFWCSACCISNQPTNLSLRMFIQSADQQEHLPPV
jgi:hypothetical protein